MDKLQQQQARYQRKKITYLVISIILDLLGMATYAFPVMGEVADTIYAPIYGMAIFMMYKQNTLAASIGGIFGAVEEFLPSTDIMPTASLLWFYTYVWNKK